MKNFCFKVVPGLLCFLISCKCPGNNTHYDSRSTLQAEKNIAKEYAILKGIETGDLSGLDTIVIESYFDHNSGEKPKGRDSLKKLLIQIHERVPDIKFSLLAASATDDHVFYLERATGTTTAPAMGWPANTTFDMTAVGFIKVKDGMFVEHQGFYRPQDILKMDSMNRAASSTKH